jgi:hypothetical protein
VKELFQRPATSFHLLTFCLVRSSGSPDRKVHAPRGSCLAALALRGLLGCVSFHLVLVRAAQRAFSSIAPKAVLSGLVALLLLIASTLSVSHSLHQALHRDAAPGGHLCLVCSFAKGQAESTGFPLALLFASLSLLFCLRIIQGSLLPGCFDYCLSLGRAPPAR